MIEIEKRGPLQDNTKESLIKILKTDGVLVGKSNQLSIFIEFDNPFLGSVENTKASISISIKNDLLKNKIQCKLKAKSGRMQSSIRKEINIPFDYNSIGEVFDFLSIFQIKTGCPRFYYREDYKYKNYSISLKEKGLAPDHFEIEIEEDDESKILSKEKEMDDFIRNMGLKIYSEKEYEEIMLKVFKDNPPINLQEIDLTVIN